jgi:Zn-dependent protease
MDNDHNVHKLYALKLKNGFTLRTSNIEIRDLIVAWLLVSLAFALARSASNGVTINNIFSLNFILYILISAVTVGIAFLLHEFAHKIVAQKYHCWAEFRADRTMLGLGVLMSVLGFVFIAPGAVMIYGHITSKQNGKISLAGPAINIILALIMLPLLFIDFSSPIISEIINSGYIINAWLALFNMIPFWNFDGAKIYKWDKKIYFLTVFISAILIFIYAMSNI